MNCIDNINGETKIYGVMGYPIAHSFSPVIHNTLANLLKYDMIYIPFKVEKNGLESAIKGAYNLNIKGINITIPHKQEVIKHIYKIDKFAKQIGAVNTLKYDKKGYKGFNTDFYGIKSCFDLREISLKNKEVVLIGAGGASKAVAIMLAANEVKKIWIINRTLKNADSIAQNVKKYYNVDIEIIGYNEIYKIQRADICIQTTSIGMSPNIQNTPIDDNNFYDKIDIAVDIIFNPWKTKFLEKAEQSGCKIINGFDMLYFQGLKSFEIWWDINIPDNLKFQAQGILENYYKDKLL